MKKFRIPLGNGKFQPCPAWVNNPLFQRLFILEPDGVLTIVLRQATFPSRDFILALLSGKVKSVNADRQGMSSNDMDLWFAKGNVEDGIEHEVFLVNDNRRDVGAVTPDEKAVLRGFAKQCFRPFGQEVVERRWGSGSRIVGDLIYAHNRCHAFISNNPNVILSERFYSIDGCLIEMVLKFPEGYGSQRALALECLDPNGNLLNVKPRIERHEF